MDLGAILLLLAVIILVVLFVSMPFTEHWRVQVAGGRQLSALMAERDRILNTIQELDFDQSLGKIPAEEYPNQRALLLQSGAEVLRRLDEIQSQMAAADGRQTGKGLRPLAARKLSDEDLEDLIANRRSLRKIKATGFCPKCGKPVMQSDRFCPSCGQAVNQA
ncbi:MAG TPA: zinc ribbon domain-containing protein [Anaerolineales bacterium]|nr:zinc ribbon domain-containing protein [Anaerolineales bacterium]